MSVIFARHPENPIVTPGLYPWRMATVFNPGVIHDDDGRFYLYEQATGLNPCRTEEMLGRYCPIKLTVAHEGNGEGDGGI